MGVKDVSCAQLAVDAVEVVVEEDANDEVLVELPVVANLNGSEAAHAAEAVSFSAPLISLKRVAVAFNVAVDGASAAASTEVEAGPRVRGNNGASFKLPPFRSAA